MNAIVIPGKLEPDPIEIDPRPCELCGCTIDRHHRVDTDEGPEFFCVDFSSDELTLDELERRAEMRHQEEVAAMLAHWEMADPRDAWRHTGEQAPPAHVRNSDLDAKAANAPQPYRPAQSTIDAFRYLTAVGDFERIREWLADHPNDALHLLALLEGQDHA